MRPRKLYKHYLGPYSTQGSFYVDKNGVLQTINTPTCLRNSPMGWWDTMIEFDRSDRYWGVSRKFSDTVKFVGDGAAIISELYHKYRAIEQLIQFVILKWNPDTDVYELFYKGLLDLRTFAEDIEGVSVNTMEGGAVQMLKTYENKMFEFPVDGSLKVLMPDGSIIRNIKVKLDGMKVQDTFHYVIPEFTAGFPGDAILPASLVSNDGDNVGIIKGSPSYAQPTDPTYFQGLNYQLSSVSPLSMRITGQVTVQSDSHMQNTVFRMYARSSLSAPRGTDGIDHAVGLVGYGNPATNPALQIWFPSNAPVVNGTTTFNFDVTFNVVANENPFILFFNQSADHPIKILGGTYTITFSSQFPATTCWGIRAYDLWRLLMLNANKLASSTIQQYNYGADSQLLQQYMGVVVTSGDAIRASGDPTYLKYFNRIQTNPANPTFQFFNFYNSAGPVIKTCIADFFDAFNPLIGCSLGNQILPGASQESIFLEEKEYVLDSSEITMTLSQVTDLKISTAEDLFFGVLKIGMPAQQYDEKAGKYESATTAQHAAPIRTEQKTLELICKYRFDPAGIEYTRSNMTKDAKSTTYNGSDSSVFLLSSDLNKSSPDRDTATFIATPLGSGDALNGNQKPLPGIAEQGVSLPTLLGTYLRPENSPAVFIFNQPTGVPGTATFSWTVIPAGLRGDTVSISIYYNGFVFITKTYTVVTAGQVFNDSVTLTESFGQGDCLYAKATTSATCDAMITGFQLAVGSGYFTANIASPQEIQPGNPGQLIPMAIQAGTQFGSTPNLYFGMSYNLPLLIFNEFLNEPNFTIAFQANGIQSGVGGQSFLLKLWLNGQVIGSQTFNSAGTFVSWSTNIANFPVLTRDMSFGDMLWVTISPTSGMTAEVGGTTTVPGAISSLTLTSTQIQVFDLLRVQYDAISGVPSLLGNTPSGAPITVGAGAPFNIEPFFTPKRMMMQNASLFASTLSNLAPDVMSFLMMDKNEYLSTTKDGVTYTENANTPVSAFGQGLFIPLWLEFKTKVKMNLSQMQSYVANGHIAIPYLDKILYGFPWKITQKPTVDEAQTWKVLCSPRTNRADLVNLNYDGLGPTLNSLMANQVSFSKVQPFQFVPYGQTRPAKYHFSHIDDDLFINQVAFWPFKRDYYQKMMRTDSFPVQALSNGLTVVPLDVYSVKPGSTPSAPAVTHLVGSVNMLPVTGPLKPPYIQLEATICFSDLGLPTGLYTIIPRGSVGNIAMCERIQVVNDFPINQPTLLFGIGNSVNKQSTVFSISASGQPFTMAFRVEGWIDQFEPDEKFTVFEDQPADIELLNAVPYEKYVLNIGCADGVPPWVIRKVARIMALDTITIDGMAYTRDADAKWQKKTMEGWPKAYWSLAIRPAFNDDAVTFGEDGSLNTDTIVTAAIDLTAFGNNPTAGPQIINVTES